jgi:DNA-binding GntR family transcriptional regulator
LRFHAVSATRRRKAIRWNHGLRREALVERLLAEILNGTLARGQRLVAQDLADRYGVSQTPIREALISLAGVGIIDLLPNRGAIVRTITRHDIVEVGQVRRALECEAVRSATSSVPHANWDQLEHDIAELKLTIERQPDASIVEVAQETDNRLHETIAAGSGNGLLSRELARLRILFKAYRDAAWQNVTLQHDFTRLLEETDEHLAILRALRHGDAEAAAHAMAHHITSGQHYWTDAVFGSSTSP